MGFPAFSYATGNWWENPCISHMIKYTTEQESNRKKHPFYEKSMGTNCSGFPHLMDFAVFSNAVGNWWETHSFLVRWSLWNDRNLIGRKQPYYRKSMSTNFPGSPRSNGFVAFSCTMGNWWGHPCISHMMEYTIGWESYGQKSPILWEKYEYQFSRFTLFDGFCCIFLYYENWWGNPCISHMIKHTIGWESNGKKVPILWRKYEPLSEEWINRRSRNHLAYTIVLVAVKLPRKLQHPILCVGLIN